MTGQDGWDPGLLSLWLTMWADDGSSQMGAPGPIDWFQGRIPWFQQRILRDVAL
jgi:hypothetical protein